MINGSLTEKNRILFFNLNCLTMRYDYLKQILQFADSKDLIIGLSVGFVGFVILLVVAVLG